MRQGCFSTSAAKPSMSTKMRVWSWSSSRFIGDPSSLTSRDDGRDREAAEAWDALATHAAKHADVCRHGAELADRTRHRQSNSLSHGLAGC